MPCLGNVSERHTCKNGAYFAPFLQAGQAPIYYFYLFVLAVTHGNNKCRD